ncbi:MAG: hypothetical protein KDD53_04380 [Bdellovibrionales bacterium]|nr:hypothetical protein [Bdellovibrionales bacterium]
MHHRFVTLLLILTMIFLCGCGDEEVASDLTQKQANEIVSRLHSHGIVSHVDKSRGGRQSYSVGVRSDDYGLAVRLLDAYGLPRPVAKSFEELTESHGLVPNTREVEAARLDYALASEIEEKLVDLPGIKDVKIVLRTNLVNEASVPSAAALIATEDGRALDRRKIIDVLKLMVPGIEESRIEVVIDSALLTKPRIAQQATEQVGGEVIYHPLKRFLKFFRVPEQDHTALTVAFLVFFLVTVLLGYLIGFAVGRYYLNIRRILNRKEDPSFQISEFPRVASSRIRQLETEVPQSGKYIGPSSNLGDR